MLATLDFYENHMYSESNGIETVARHYVFVKWFQVLGDGGNCLSPEKYLKIKVWP